MGIILLANNPDVFLQTILSRCVVLDLKPLKDDVVIKYLKDHYDNIGDYECKFAASCGWTNRQGNDYG